MKVSLKWITPDTDKMIAHMARVSNPSASPDDPADRLITYLLKHKHFSPFEMACACVEIVTTRDIARQILRHRSFHFQEFSQRYAEVDEEPEIGAIVRRQDVKNRQNSVVSNDAYLNGLWKGLQESGWESAYNAYSVALKSGIAKELARKLLPEGLTKTHMYMQGTLRDWLHYLAIRQERETQYEHRAIAHQIRAELEATCPTIFQAAVAAGVIGSAELAARDDERSEGGCK